MKLYEHSGVKGVKAMVSVGNNRVLTGHRNGDIKLWTLRKTYQSYNLRQDKLFHASSAIRHLTLLSNDRFISSCDNEIRIWSLSSGICEKVLNKEVLRDGSILLTLPHSIVSLGDDLIAISGNCSEAYE